MSLHSAHIFLFPFKWSVASAEKEKNFSERFSLEAQLDKNHWEPFRFKFQINKKGDYNTYNEYAYFHDYTRDILSLDQGGSVSKKQFSYRLPEKPVYQIKILDGDALHLEIEDITLNFYECGVGVFAFHLNNSFCKDFDKILKINEYGRRIYPQFLGSKSTFTEAPKFSFLPDSIALLGFDQEIQENFSHYSNFTIPENETSHPVQQHPFRIPNHMGLLLGPEFSARTENGKIHIEPIIDDRMFTMSFLINTDKLNNLREYNEQKESYSWRENIDWYRYVFVDDSTAGCQSKSMMRQLINSVTYDRWIDHIGKWGVEKNKPVGHLFGVSRYSFVVLTADCWFGNNLLIHHFKSLYFQMTQLALVQRASILNFSSEVSHIIADRPTIETVSDLYFRYINFINKIYFREITPQEQGIELYKLLHAQMEIEQNVKDLDGEISELHGYVQLQETNQQSKNQEIQNRELAKLSKLAAIFLPATLVLSFFGMSYFSNTALTFGAGKFNPRSPDFLSVLVIVALVAVLIAFSQKLLKILIKRFKL